LQETIGLPDASGRTPARRVGLKHPSIPIPPPILISEKGSRFVTWFRGQNLGIRRPGAVVRSGPAQKWGGFCVCRGGSSSSAALTCAWLMCCAAPALHLRLKASWARVLFSAAVSSVLPLRLRRCTSILSSTVPGTPICGPRRPCHLSHCVGTVQTLAAGLHGAMFA
jgi:hypothetical protein